MRGFFTFLSVVGILFLLSCDSSQPPPPPAPARKQEPQPPAEPEGKPLSMIEEERAAREEKIRPITASLVSDRPIPIIVIWTGETESDDPLAREEAGLLATVLRDRALWPEPLVCHMPLHPEDRLIPARDSRLYKPMREWTDEELSIRGRALGAGRMLRLGWNRDGGSATLVLRVIDPAGATTTWQREFTGTLAEVDVAAGAAWPEVIVALGANPPGSMQEQLRQPLLGDPDSFLAVALARQSGQDGATAAPFEEWTRKAPGNPTASTAVAISRYLEGDEAARAQILATWESTPPLNASIGLALSERMEEEGRPGQAAEIYKALQAAYPGLVTPVLYESWVQAVRRHDKEADDAIARAQSIAPASYIPHFYQGLVCSQIAAVIQNGNSRGMMNSQSVVDVDLRRRDAAAAWERAHAAAPWDARVIAGFADHLMWTSGNAERVIALAREAFERSPSNPAPVSTMIWACAPGYANRRDEGLRLYREFRPVLMENPWLMRQCRTALMQIATRSISPRREDISKFMDSEPELAYDLVNSLLVASDVDIEHAPGGTHEDRPLANAVQEMSGKRWPPADPELFCRVTERWPDAHAGVPAQYYHIQVAEICLSIGDLDRAQRWFEKSATGRDKRIIAYSQGGRAIVRARRGDVEGALADLAQVVQRPEYISEIKAQILACGTPEQRAEAVQEAKLAIEKNFTISTALALLTALEANGQHEEVRAHVIQYNKDKAGFLNPALRGFWERANTALGKSTAWPPPAGE